MSEQATTRSSAGASAAGEAQFRHELAQQLRVDSVRASAGAGSGHPTSSMSAADLMAVLLDLVDGEKHAAAVDALLLTGCVAAVPTAITGAHDLATTTGAATRVAIVHAGTMDVTLALFSMAWVRHRRGNRRGARRLAVAGVATAGVGAYLGGHLVYRLGVGVED